MRAERAEREHDAFDVAAAQRGDGGRGARMRNRHELRAGERVDELHAEVADRADARMSDAHAAGILLRVIDELREALRAPAAHRQHARRARADAERHEIAHRVVRDALAVENDAKGERAVLREKDRLPVLASLRHARRGERAARAGAIHREHRRIEMFGHLFRHRARRDVGRVARRKRDNDVDGAVGKGMNRERRKETKKCKSHERIFS